MIQVLKLLIQDIKDQVLKTNFEKIQKYTDGNGHLDGFKFIEFTKDKNEANFKVAHGLSIVPKDAVVLRLIAPTASVKLSINWGLSDSANLDMTVSGLSTGEAMTVRMFVGSFKGANSGAAVESSDVQIYKGRH